MDIKLSEHAGLKLKERVSISIHDFKKIYLDSKYLPLGIEESSRRQHDLFFSKNDNQCFVSIRDIKNNEIVTILPINYHKNISWEVSSDAQTLARRIYHNEEVFNFNTHNDNSKKSKTNPPPTSIKIVARCNGHITKITSTNFEDYDYDFNLVAKDLSLRGKIRDFVKKNRELFDDNFCKIVMKFGSNRNPVSEQSFGVEFFFKGVCEIEENQLKIFDLVGDLKKEGMSNRKIAKHLNLIEHKNHHGKVFTPSSIQFIIKHYK